MKFRTDINGLRAIAVAGVILYHFSPNTLTGGFIGVDVFFVISGFLMTGIILKGLASKNFSILSFYIARFNRIAPALSVLCLFMMVFGLFVIPPSELTTLSQHVAASVGFLSNLVYYREAGYFDVSSHDKWLLHTWSLSVEWQFYIIYPVVLSAIYNLFKYKGIQIFLVFGTIISFFLSSYASTNWPSAAYYMLPTRAWELMAGGLAYLFPISMSYVNKRIMELLGVFIIAMSYYFIDSSIAWPGYYALIPVVGTYLVIISRVENSIVTNNILFNYIGRWSYSIYLWHWPIVVVGYYYLYERWWLIGIPLSLLFGALSYKIVESQKVKRNNTLISFFTSKPFAISFITLIVCFIIQANGGFNSRYPEKFNNVLDTIVSSPYRDECHISSYKDPINACEYSNEDISWATIGDSHAVELSYALSKKLNKTGKGLKHFSFSGCSPAYGQEESFSNCTRWQNEAVKVIVNDNRIKNVVIIFRYSGSFFGDNTQSYPMIDDHLISKRVLDMTESLDSLINKLAITKKKVYVYYPIPELGQGISKIINQSNRLTHNVENIHGTTVSYFKQRNMYIIDHFANSNYPDNVVLVKPSDSFCNQSVCFAVKDSKSLYFDANHPSNFGADKLVELLNID